MRWRGLLVCSGIVLAAHGALLDAMTGRGLQQAVGSTSGGARRSPASLVLLARDQVAALTAPPAPTPALDAPAVEASAPPKAPDAVATSDRTPTTAAPGPTATIYRAPAELDAPPRARSAPDVAILNGLAWSGTPIRLRVFIDDQGKVDDVKVLESGETDEVIALVRRVFLSTGFTPGVEHGLPVPSYKDIEITVGAPH